MTNTKSKPVAASKQTPSTAQKRFQPPRGFWAVCIVMAALAVTVGIAHWLFGSSAMPNVIVGNRQVAQLSAPQIKQVVQQEVSALNVVFKDGDKSTQVSMQDLGVSIDVDATVKQALLAGRGSDILSNLSLWQNKNVPLVYTNDAGVLKQYITQHFPQLYVDPQDAHLEFNAKTGQYDLVAGVPGKGFDIKSFEAALPDLAKNPRTVTLPLQTVPVQPLITEQALKSVQEQANKQVQLHIEFTHNGTTAYTLAPSDIAAWLHFTADPVKGTVKPEFDKAQIQQFLSDTVGGKITTLPVDRKVVVDDTTGTQFVIQQGSAGNQLADADKLADAVLGALNANQPLTQEVSVEQAPFKTVTIKASGKWIEVDLSRQTATMYIGSQPVQSFLISSGKAATPTEIGTFYIYRKLPITTMTGTILGEYYYVPDIPWVSFFDGGEAFHGTYWHHNFGHPMSHGCINMAIPDAKILYDFAPIGTKVVVHD